VLGILLALSLPRCANCGKEGNKLIYTLEAVQVLCNHPLLDVLHIILTLVIHNFTVVVVVDF